jgi:hypothetical protein
MSNSNSSTISIVCSFSIEKNIVELHHFSYPQIFNEIFFTIVQPPIMIVLFLTQFLFSIVQTCILNSMNKFSKPRESMVQRKEIVHRVGNKDIIHNNQRD